jgi:phage terminase large subunit-like protein
MEFFAAGSKFGERLFMAANRIGKSDAGAYEVTCHLTGNYPAWWKGRRFTSPVEVWACGTNSETTRDIVQAKLLGRVDSVGTGMIPGDLISNPTPRRSGLAGALEGALVRHASGGNSILNLKTYEQGRSSFEGTAKHVIWCDEEPPMDCYTEMLYRTVTTRGIVFTTFTPLQGMSDVVKSFMEPEKEESKQYKWYIQAGWQDVPHLDEDEKKRLLATTLPYLIDARTKGEPALGVGAIYPISESDVSCDPFAIHETWPRVYALDVGWNRTAAIWGARDPGSNVIYLYSEHYQGQGEPASHALAIKGRGDWINGVIDPASVGVNQIDGRSVREVYNALGLHLTDANNTVEAGITQVWQMLLSGKLKVFSSLQNWFREFRKYHRDDKGQGRIVKKDDHLMDATRYLVMSGIQRMQTYREANPQVEISRPNYAAQPGSWMR